MLIQNIFVAHWQRLVQRKNHITEQLKNNNLLESNIEFVIDYDKDNWNVDQLKQEFPKVFEIVEGSDPWSGIPYNRKLKYSEISLLLKHVKIIREIADKYQWALVLEDDAVFCPNFVYEFEKSFSELPDDWDLAFVGGCCGLHAPGYETGKSRVYKVDGRSRCTHGYIISNKCANKILEDLIYCNIGSDYFLSHMAIKYNLNNYWFEPDLISQSPEFYTTIQNEEYY